MITTKQRAYLRSQANNLDTLLQIGKGGISEALTVQVDALLKAKELVKMHVLDSAMMESRTAAQTLAESMGAEIVQVIGSRFVLFRRNIEDPVILIEKDEILPKKKAPKSKVTRKLHVKPNSKRKKLEIKGKIKDSDGGFKRVRVVSDEDFGKKSSRPSFKRGASFSSSGKPSYNKTKPNRSKGRGV